MQTGKFGSNQSIIRFTKELSTMSENNVGTDNFTNARIAYNAYCEFTEWKSLISGATLPEFDKLDIKIKQAWKKAAMAAIEAAADRTR